MIYQPSYLVDNYEIPNEPKLNMHHKDVKGLRSTNTAKIKQRSQRRKIPLTRTNPDKKFVARTNIRKRNFRLVPQK